MNDSGKNIFLICPVRFASEEEKTSLENYVSSLESQGHKVHYPPRDTNQFDETGGYNICRDNLQVIKSSDEVHIYWNGQSYGSHFDFGASFNEHLSRNMPIRLANRKGVEDMVVDLKGTGKEKAFEFVLLKLDDLYN